MPARIALSAPAAPSDGGRLELTGGPDSSSMEPSSKGRSSFVRSLGSRRAMASNRIGIVEFLLGMVIVYFAYSLSLIHI